MTVRTPDDGFAPISPNPYIVGNPVRGRTMFFGREAEFELVRRRFQHSTRGGLLVFCGERRSGKTSILFQIMDGRLGPDFMPVLIDMQSMAVENEVEFLTRISEEVRASLGPGGEAIPLPTFSPDSSRSATFQQFVRQVLKKESAKKLILLFDEYELFENKIEARHLSEDVLHVLAALMESQPVFLIFTGSQHLEQRRHEYWKILGKSQHKMISFLEREDAERLVRQPVEGRVRYHPDTVEGIWRLTAGQPFYTQAICQSLVDQLNERRVSDVTPALLAAVVESTVNNPLPQMIFLWDGLERLDKLVLALLAEALPDPNARAGIDDLKRHLRRKDYPLALERAEIATTLEKLFKGETLLRSDQGADHGYAFRMDLWRLWIRRQHSVWQVLREEGLEIRPGRERRLRKSLLLGGAVLVIAAILVVGFERGRRKRAIPAPVPSPPGLATIALEVEPGQAVISLDGQQVGLGRYRGVITAAREHRLEIRAAGYADSVLVERPLAAGDSISRRVVLRERLGSLRIVTDPPGAEVRVDGTALGPSPVVVPSLSAARVHRVEATLAGWAPARQDVSVTPDQTESTTLALEQLVTELLVTSEPSKFEIHVDGGLRGRTPLSIADLRLGPHTVTAVHEGFLPAETTLTVGPDTRRLHFAPPPAPPGSLVVKVDRYDAEIWIDGVMSIANVPIVRQDVRPGRHQIKVVLPDGKSRDTTLVVNSRERVVYDYTRGAVERQPQGGP